MSPVSDDGWRAKNRADRGRFAREMALEMARLSGRIQALATLISHYLVEDPDQPPFALPARTAEPGQQRAKESSLATSPRAQNEGLDIQGGDRKAQKEVAIPVVSSARTASAEVMQADLRNSSRSPAADSPPASPASGERTTTSNVVPKGEQVMALWATTALSVDEIAARVGCPRGSVSGFVSHARKKGDRRSEARVAASARGDVAAQPSPRLPPVAPARIAAPSSIVSFDPVGEKIFGPRGIWSAGAGIVRMLDLLNDGQMHSVDALTKAGGWSSPAMFSSRLGFISEKLNDIGVRFTYLRGQGCKIEAARS